MVILALSLGVLSCPVFRAKSGKEWAKECVLGDVAAHGTGFSRAENALGLGCGDPTGAGY